MLTQFFGERIKVELNEEKYQPISFVWRGKKHIIIEIKSAWQDYGFGSSPAPRRVAWRSRHHRTYYRVVTEDKTEFELYYDRAAKERVWILAQKIT